MPIPMAPGWAVFMAPMLSNLQFPLSRFLVFTRLIGENVGKVDYNDTDSPTTVDACLAISSAAVRFSYLQELVVPFKWHWQINIESRNGAWTSAPPLSISVRAGMGRLQLEYAADGNHLSDSHCYRGSVCLVHPQHWNHHRGKKQGID